MDRLTIVQCRKLIGHSTAEMSDDEVTKLRDTLYALGEVLADAFADLAHIDQSLFNPKNDLDDWLEAMGEQQ